MLGVNKLDKTIILRPWAFLFTFYVILYVVVFVKHRLLCRRRRDVVPRNSVAVVMATLRSRGRGNRYSPMSSSTIKHNTHIGNNHKEKTFLLSWQLFGGTLRPTYYLSLRSVCECDLRKWMRLFIFIWVFVCLATHYCDFSTWFPTKVGTLKIFVFND